MALQGLQTSQVLHVLVDESGARNVPESSSRDGHTVKGVIPDDGHRRVVIEKG